MECICLFVAGLFLSRVKKGRCVFVSRVSVCLREVFAQKRVLAFEGREMCCVVLF